MAHFPKLRIEADGGSRGNPGPAGYGAVVKDPKTGDVLAERAGWLGEATNNVAEYSGLIAGLKAAAEINPDAFLEIWMDSKLVVEQMSGNWKIKHEHLRALAMEANALIDRSKVKFEWMPRHENSTADALANKAMDERQSTFENYWFRADAASAASASLAEDTAARPNPARPATLGKPSSYATIVLVRHGHTAMTEAGQVSGSVVPGPSLSELGRAEADAAARIVAQIGTEIFPELPVPSHLIASPTQRTQDTATALGRELGLDYSVDERFVEVGFGNWEGLDAQQLDERYPGGLTQWFTDGVTRPDGAGGESWVDVSERVWPALLELAESAAGSTIVICTHSVVIRSSLGRAVAAPPNAWSRLRVQPASVSILRLSPKRQPDIPIIGLLPTRV